MDNQLKRFELFMGSRVSKGRPLFGLIDLLASRTKFHSLNINVLVVDRCPTCGHEHIAQTNADVSIEILESDSWKTDSFQKSKAKIHEFGGPGGNCVMNDLTLRKRYIGVRVSSSTKRTVHGHATLCR